MNLQLALIGLGILVVVAIYYYSRWQQPQNRKNSTDIDSAENLRKQPIFDRDEPSLSNNSEPNPHLFDGAEEQIAESKDGALNVPIDDHNDELRSDIEVDAAPAYEPPYITPYETQDQTEQEVQAESVPVQEEIPVLDGRVDLEQVEDDATDRQEPMDVDDEVFDDVNAETLNIPGDDGGSGGEEIVDDVAEQVDVARPDSDTVKGKSVEEIVEQTDADNQVAQRQKTEPPLTLPIDAAPEPEFLDAETQSSLQQNAHLEEDGHEELDYAADAAGIAEAPAEQGRFEEESSTDTEIETDFASDVESEDKAESGAIVQDYEPEPEPGVDAEPNAELDAEPEAEVEAERNAELDAAPEAEVEAERNAELDAAPEAEVEVEPHAELHAEPYAVVEAVPDAELDTEPEVEAEEEPDAEAEAEADIDNGDIDMDSELPLLELEMADTEEGFSVLKMDDLSGKDLDQEEDLLQQRPSLAKFISSMGPFNKIKDTIQNKLDSVKEERHKTLAEEEMTDDEFFTMREEEAAVARKAEEERLAAIEEAELELIELETGELEDSAIILPSLNPGSTEQPMDNMEVEVHDSTDRESTTSANQSHKAPELNTGNQDQALSPAEGFEKLSQIDYYVKLSGERDVSRESVLAIYREGAAGLSKNHSIYGLLLPSKVWRDLENEPEESRFGDLVITVQLVDQDGPVSESDMTRFSSLVMKLSESTGRGFAFMAPIENAHEQAQAIDKFRRKFESIFVVNIRPLEDEMFEGAIIDRCAGQIGLTADDNNFYARYKPVGKQKVCLYSLANMSDTGEFDLENMRAMRTRGVTFFTRPAVNRSPGAVFSEMVDAAKAFASRIKGEVIAPGYDDLSMEDVEAIRRSIETVAREMESYGINPGSEEATRLF